MDYKINNKNKPKYGKEWGLGIGALTGGGLGYLAATKALGKKDDFIAKTLRRYPGMTKAAAEEIYKETKRKYLITGTLGGAVAGGGTGVLIGSKLGAGRLGFTGYLQRNDADVAAAAASLEAHKENILGTGKMEGFSSAKTNNSQQTRNNYSSQKHSNDDHERVKIELQEVKAQNKKEIDEINSMIKDW